MDCATAISFFATAKRDFAVRTAAEDFVCFLAGLCWFLRDIEEETPFPAIATSGPVVGGPCPPLGLPTFFFLPLLHGLSALAVGATGATLFCFRRCSP